MFESFASLVYGQYPEEKQKYVDTTIAFGPETFMNPREFLSVKINEGMLGTLRQFRVFVHSDDMGFQFTERPPNLQFDTLDALVFYKEPATPTRGYGHLHTALGVCGFSVVALEKNGGYALDIEQFQTKKFIDQEQMKEEMGHIYFKDVLAHVLEQMSVYLNRKGYLINFVSRVVDLPDHREKKMAHEHLSHLVGGLSPFDHDKVIQQEIVRMREERKRWAKNRGYNREINKVNPNHGFMLSAQKSLGKEVRNIKVDPKLQVRLEQIFL